MSIWDRLRKTFQAVREYPRVVADLNMARSELRQVWQELEHRDEDYSLLSQEMEEQRYDLKFQSQQSSGLRAALLEFCPSLSSAEDMKRFYDTVSLTLDAQGFVLNHMAKQLTGIGSLPLLKYRRFCPLVPEQGR